MNSFLRLFLTWIALDAALLVIWMGLAGLTGRDSTGSGGGLPTKIASTIIVVTAAVSGLSLFSSGVRHVVIEPLAESAIGILQPEEGGSPQPVEPGAAARVPPEAVNLRPSAGTTIGPGPSAAQLSPVAPFVPVPALSRSDSAPSPGSSATPSPSPSTCPSDTPSPSETTTPPPDSSAPPADPSCPTPSPTPTDSPSETPSESPSEPVPGSSP